MVVGVRVCGGRGRGASPKARPGRGVHARMHVRERGSRQQLLTPPPPPAPGTHPQLPQHIWVPEHHHRKPDQHRDQCRGDGAAAPSAAGRSSCPWRRPAGAATALVPAALCAAACVAARRRQLQGSAAGSRVGTEGAAVATALQQAPPFLLICRPSICRPVAAAVLGRWRRAGPPGSRSGIRTRRRPGPRSPQGGQLPDQRL